MTDRPIIFSGPMVRALLEGRKTQTRRLLYSKRKARNGLVPGSATVLQDHPPPRGRLGPQGFPTDIGPDEYYTLSGWQNVKPGDRLWVRESFVYCREKISKKIARQGYVEWLHYRATEEDSFLPGMPWRPSIHMPREHSRLTLVVTGTKIERLQQISEEDARAEGIEQRIVGVDFGDGKRESTAIYSDDLDGRYGAPGASYSAKEHYRLLWSWLHGRDSWDADPAVVALAFTVHQSNIDAMPKDAAA